MSLALAPRAGGAAVLAGATLGLVLLRGRLAFYEDERINLLKAYAVSQGQPLYSQVFSDQAPLHTLVLAGLFGLFGPGYGVGQALAVSAALALLGAAYALATALANRVAGAIAVLLLMLSLPFLRFATSALITVPALALAAWSLRLALGRPGRLPVWAGSGLLLGLAITTKLAFAYFLPVVVAAAWRGVPPGARRRGYGLWLAAALAPPLGLLLLWPASVLHDQLLAPHLAGYVAYAERAAAARARHLLAPGMLAYYAATAIAAGTLLARQRPGAPILVLWLAVVGTWMLTHRPLWPHHVVDLILPITVTIAVALGHLLVDLTGRTRARRSPLQALVCAGIVLAVLAGLAGQWHARRRWLGTPDTFRGLTLVGDRIRRHSWADETVIVDRPILAFLAGRRPPPQLVVISDKRIEGGRLTEEDLLEALERHRPAVIALCSPRFDRFPRFLRRVAEEYREVERRRIVGDRLARGRPCLVHARPGAAAGAREPRREGERGHASRGP